MLQELYNLMLFPPFSEFSYTKETTEWLVETWHELALLSLLKIL